MNSNCNSPKNLALMVINQRKKLKLSQSAIADKVGLKQTTISAFENNPGSTKLDTVFRILSAVKLDLSLVELDKKPKYWKEEW